MKVFLFWDHKLGWFPALQVRGREQMADDKHRPFHCGTQAADWEENNCAVCVKGASEDPDKFMDTLSCPIQKAITEAYWDDGSVSEEIAERMGYLDNSPPRQKGFSLIWLCKERQLAD